jgi:predicted RNA-binding protein (virulence factor B family)
VSKRAYKEALGGLYRKKLADLSPGLVKLVKG